MGWLITLGILILLAILPLGATVRYNEDGLLLKLISGPARIKILPSQKDKPQKEKKDKKAKKENKQKPGKKPAPKTEKKEEKGGPVTDFLPLVKVALDLLNSFRRKLRVRHLQLKLILAGDDPCDLAINYGRANAALGNLLPQLERCLVIQKRDLEIECDFEASQTVVIARADVTITLGWLLAIAVWYGMQAVISYVKIQNKRKGGASS